MLLPFFLNIVNWDAMDDIFDSSLNLEDTHYKEGYDQGHTDGLVSGKDEARQVGLKVGFEVGEELGFYAGCVAIWSSAIQLDPTCFSSRAKAGISQMEELLHKYPLMNPEDVRVQEIMDSLRLKFKMGVVAVNISESRSRNAYELGSVERAARLFRQVPMVN